MLEFANCESDRQPIIAPLQFAVLQGNRASKNSALAMIVQGGLAAQPPEENLTRYRPLFDGSDPDGIMPLVQIWQALTSIEKAAIGPYLPYGIFADWAQLLTVEGVNDPHEQITDLQFKKTWAEALNVTQRTVLLKFLTQQGVSSSDYGRPLFNADPDGVIRILGVMGEG